MELSWDTSEVFSRYKSNSQRVRCLSEKWFSEEMFCPACLSDSLESYKTGNPVADFFCPECEEKFQLKSQGKPLAGRINDGAYSKMIDAVRKDAAPNFFLLHYDPAQWMVADLVVVPKTFFTESIIEKRKPLAASARRSGWVGCNLLLSGIPLDGRIQVVEEYRPVEKTAVRSVWKRTSFLKEGNAAKRSWLVDTMWCVRDLGKEAFSLEDVYAYEGHLKKLHPENNNIQPKIRQQLQFLRDAGYLSFVERGRYKVRK